MSEEIKQVMGELRTAWSELQHRIEDNEAKTAEGRAGVDLVNDRIDQLEAQATKGSLATEGSSGSRETKALMEFTRTGRRPEGSNLKAIDQAGNEIKALVLGNEVAGGVLAPPQFVDQVVKGIVQFSPIRQIANVIPTNRVAIQYPKRTGLLAASWTSETGTRTETAGQTYGLDELPNHELYSRVLVSNQLLEDAGVPLEQLIVADMAQQFGVSEGSAFVAGNGVGKPEGFLANADVQANVTHYGGAAFTDDLGADALIALTTSVKEQYWPNGRFVLNRSTLRAIRTLHDSQGNYLWQPTPDGTHGVVNGLAPATLLGFPYVLAIDMPDAAANTLPVAFGDFQAGYWISDRISIEYLRDPYTAAAAGTLILHARKRVGGQVVLPEALAVLSMSAGS